MRKFLYILFVLAFLLSSSVLPGYAAGEYARLTDEADVLTDSEEAEILAKLDQLSDRHLVDIVICTVPSVGEYSAEEYTDNLF